MNRPITVLIIDDSPVICERLIEELNVPDVIEIIGTTGRLTEARELIKTHQPHIITLDLDLEDGNGLDLLRELRDGHRGEDDHKNPKVIVLTNHSSPIFREKCRQLGADHFLDKATDFEKVRQSVIDLAGG